MSHCSWLTPLPPPDYPLTPPLWVAWGLMPLIKRPKLGRRMCKRCFTAKRKSLYQSVRHDVSWAFMLNGNKTKIEWNKKIAHSKLFLPDSGAGFFPVLHILSQPHSQKIVENRFYDPLEGITHRTTNKHWDHCATLISALRSTSYVRFPCTTYFIFSRICEKMKLHPLNYPMSLVTMHMKSLSKASFRRPWSTVPFHDPLVGVHVTSGDFCTSSLKTGWDFKRKMRISCWKTTYCLLDTNFFNLLHWHAVDQIQNKDNPLLFQITELAN